MNEQREALAEVLLPLYRTAVDDRHDIDYCLCGGECFRESDLRAGAAEWADRVLASPALARLFAAAEQRGAARVAAAVEVIHQSSEVARGVGQQRDGRWTPYCELDGESWPCDTIAALTPAAAQDPA